VVCLVRAERHGDRIIGGPTVLVQRFLTTTRWSVKLREVAERIASTMGVYDARPSARISTNALPFGNSDEQALQR